MTESQYSSIIENFVLYDRKLSGRCALARVEMITSFFKYTLLPELKQHAHRHIKDIRDVKQHVE